MSLLSSLEQGFNKAVQTVKNVASGIGRDIENVVRPVGQAINRRVVQPVERGISNVEKGVSNEVQQFKGNIQRVTPTIAPKMSSEAHDLILKVQQAASQEEAKFYDLLNKAKTNTKVMASKEYSAVSNDLGHFQNFLKNSSAAGYVNGVVDNLKKGVSTVKKDINPSLQTFDPANMASFLKQKGVDVYNYEKQPVSPIEQKASNLVRGVLKYVANSGDVFTNKLNQISLQENKGKPLTEQQKRFNSTASAFMAGYMPDGAALSEEAKNALYGFIGKIADSKVPSEVVDLLDKAGIHPPTDILDMLKGNVISDTNELSQEAKDYLKLLKNVTEESRPAQVAGKIIDYVKSKPEIINAAKDTEAEAVKVTKELASGEKEVPKPVEQAAKEPITEATTKAKNAGSKIKQVIAQNREASTVATDIGKSLAHLGESAKADLVRVMSALKDLKLSPKDEEAIYHYAENKSEPITAEQKKVYDEVIKPMQDEATRIYQKVSGKLPIESDAYIARQVAGKGGLLDRLKEGVSNVSARVSGSGLLSKSAPSLKKRIMKAVVDEAGNRTVVAVRDGRVTGFVKGATQDLGALKIKSLEQLMEQDIKPAQDKLNNLRKQLSAVSKVTTPTDSRLRSLNHQIQQAVTSFIDSTANFTTIENDKIIHQLGKELVKEEEFLKKAKSKINKEEIITRLNNSISKVESAIEDIKKKYNPSELNNKRFVAKGGKIYRFAEATTKEIEANTKLRYHKTAILNTANSYLRMKQIERAVDTLNAIKNSDAFAKLSFKEGDGIPPQGWRQSLLPQFRGIYLEPHIADELDRMQKQLERGGSALGIISKTNRFLRDSIVLNPLMHVPNIANLWAVSRGATSLINPVAYARLAKTSFRAISTIAAAGEEYAKALDDGLALHSMSGLNENFYQTIARKAIDDLRANPTMAKKIANALGYVDGQKLIGGISRFSTKFTFIIHDLATLQRYYEEMARGKTGVQAAEEVGKVLGTYRMPTRILGSAKLRQALENPNMTVFANYHIGLLQTYTNLFKDALTRGTIKEKAEAWDKLAMLGIISLVLYPIADEAAKKATGDNKTYVRRSGLSTIPYNFFKATQGQEQWTTFFSSLLTPAIGSEAALETFFNRDFYTGQNIYDPTQGSASAIGQIIGTFASQLGPIQDYQIYSKKKNPMQSFLLSLGGINTPKNSQAELAAESLMYDESGTLAAQVKDLYNAGDPASIQKANGIIDDFNQRLYNNIVQSIKDEGLQKPSDAQIYKALSLYWLKPPTQKSLNTRAAKEALPNTIDKILGIKLPPQQ